MGYIVTLKECIKDDIIPLKERWFLRMKVISLTCPGCGANLSMEDGRKQCFCQYCGMKIMLDDESITYRTVDEARIKEAELQAMLKLKQMEVEEQKRNDRKAEVKTKVILTAILGLIGALTFIVGYSNESLSPLIGIGSLALMGTLLIWVCDDANNHKNHRK